MVRFIKGYIVWLTSVCIFYLLIFAAWVLLDKGHSFWAPMLFALIHDYFWHFKIGFESFFMGVREENEQ